MLVFLVGIICGVLLTIGIIFVTLFRLGRPVQEYKLTLNRQKNNYNNDQRSIVTPKYLKSIKFDNFESCNWLNVIMYRIWLSFLKASNGIDFADIVTNRFNELDIPEFVEPIKCIDIDLGPSLPELSVIKVVDWNNVKEPIRLEATFKYNGEFRIKIGTELRIRAGHMHLASLPVQLEISNLDLSFNVFIDFGTDINEPTLSFTLVDDPHIDFKLHSDIGDSVQIDLPHIKNIIIRAIRKDIENLMPPTLVLDSIYPNSLNKPHSD